MFIIGINGGSILLNFGEDKISEILFSFTLPFIIKGFLFIKLIIFCSEVAPFRKAFLISERVIIPMNSFFLLVTAQMLTLFFSKTFNTSIIF